MSICSIGKPPHSTASWTKGLSAQVLAVNVQLDQSVERRTEEHGTKRTIVGARPGSRATVAYHGTKRAIEVLNSMRNFPPSEEMRKIGQEHGLFKQYERGKGRVDQSIRDGHNVQSSP